MLKKAEEKARKFKLSLSSYDSEALIRMLLLAYGFKKEEIGEKFLYTDLLKRYKEEK